MRIGAGGSPSLPSAAGLYLHPGRGGARSTRSGSSPGMTVSLSWIRSKPSAAHTFSAADKVRLRSARRKRDSRSAPTPVLCPSWLKLCPLARMALRKRSTRPLSSLCDRGMTIPSDGSYPMPSYTRFLEKQTRVHSMGRNRRVHIHFASLSEIRHNSRTSPRIAGRRRFSHGARRPLSRHRHIVRLQILQNLAMRRRMAFKDLEYLAEQMQYIQRQVRSRCLLSVNRLDRQRPAGTRRRFLAGTGAARGFGRPETASPRPTRRLRCRLPQLFA